MPTWILSHRTVKPASMSLPKTVVTASICLAMSPSVAVMTSSA